MSDETEIQFDYIEFSRVRYELFSKKLKHLVNKYNLNEELMLEENP